MSQRRPAPWSLIGVCLGFALALWQAIGLPLPFTAPTDDGVAARVNDAVITQAEYARAVEAIAADKRNPMTEADRARALDTLITEELLVQQAEAIGLTHADRGVRKAIVDAMLQYVLGGLATEVPTDDQLRELYEQRPSIGREPDSLRVRAAVLADDGAGRIERLKAGEAFDRVFPTQLPVPDRLLRTDELDRWLPPSVIEVIENIAPGEVAAPLQIGEHRYFVWLLAREPGGRPAFDDLRDTLRALWQRERREAAVAGYVARLRGNARLTISESP